MNLETLWTRLAHNAEATHALVRGVGAEQARWKPTPDDWSILEVINHLYDEEIEDFRAHLDHILHRSGQAWPRIDPTSWVTARRYNERELDQSLTNFLAARRESLDWLRSLGTPDWEARAAAPFGPIRAGEMMAAWVAHDMLHQRQLVELQWAYLTRQVTPYQVHYAGEW
jgi:hypothetical protein